MNLITLHLLPVYSKTHRAEKLRNWAAVCSYTAALRDQGVAMLVLKAIDANLLFPNLWHVCGT